MLALDAKIRQGSVATVWECVHRSTGIRYCVKAIDTRRFGRSPLHPASNTTINHQQRTMALREIAMYRAILLRQEQQQETAILPDHPEDEEEDDNATGLPRIRDIFAATTDDYHHQQQQQQYWYIVQEYVAGGNNLGMYLAPSSSLSSSSLASSALNHDIGSSSGSSNSSTTLGTTMPTTLLSEPCVRSLARSLLFALSKLHAMQVCHNDIRPENILVQQQQQPQTQPAVLLLPKEEAAEFDSSSDIVRGQYRHHRRDSSSSSSGGVGNSLSFNSLVSPQRRGKKRITMRQPQYPYPSSSSNSDRQYHTKDFVAGVDDDDDNDTEEDEECDWKELKLCDLGRSKFMVPSATTNNRDDYNNDDGSNSNSNSNSESEHCRHQHERLRASHSVANSHTSNGIDDNPRHSSLYYTSPEVLLGQEACLASDMWSVGVLLYLCFSGQLPFRIKHKHDGTNTATNSTSTINFTPSLSVSPFSSSMVPSITSSLSIGSYNSSTATITRGSADPGYNSNENTINTMMCTRKIRKEIKRQICRAEYDFGSSKSSHQRKSGRRGSGGGSGIGHVRSASSSSASSYTSSFSWSSHASRGAKQFIASLLHKDPSVRMTCAEALAHPWLVHDVSDRSRDGTYGGGVSRHHYHLHPQYNSPAIPSPTTVAGRTTNMLPALERREQHQQQQHTYAHNNRAFDSTATVVTSSNSTTSDNSTIATTMTKYSTKSPSIVHRLFDRLKKSHHRHRSTKSDSDLIQTTTTNVHGANRIQYYGGEHRRHLTMQSL